MCKQDIVKLVIVVVLMVIDDLLQLRFQYLVKTLIKDERHW